MTPRTLCVWFDTELVGRLTDTNNIWSFHYEEFWLSNRKGFDLAPSLPRQADPIIDGSSVRPVQWFFDNLLPEEQAREVLCVEFGYEKGDSFALLEHYGRESVGALILLSEGCFLNDEGASQLSFEALSRRIASLPVAPLTAEAPKKMSLAGAQHKLMVIYKDGALFEPIGRTLSTHILKPDNQYVDKFPHTAANEWFVMQLARRAGLKVPETHFLRMPEPVFLVERFDRASSADGMNRIHMLDGCQLLEVPGIFKYTSSTLENLNRIIGFCRNRAATRQEIFRWMVLNTLVGNGDAHLKNLSVFCGPDGMSLTPHYDLLSTSIYENGNRWGDHDLSWPIGAAKTFGDIEGRHLCMFGRDIGVSDSFANRSIAMLAEVVQREAGLLLEEVEMRVEHRFSPGELRLLRQIVYGPIRETSSKLLRDAARYR